MTKRRVSTEIKLLRLELVPAQNSPCEDIGFEWIPAQPAENLSPQKAAESLGVEEWAFPSDIRTRYKKLLLRYPPEQFMQKHLDWRPAFELLSNPSAHLNWYWQSGAIPGLASPDARKVLGRLIKHYKTCTV